VGGRVFMDQVLLEQSSNNNLYVNNLSNTNVEMHDVQSLGDVQSGDAVSVVGASAPNSAYVNIFGAASSCDKTNMVRTSNYANFTLRQLWYDYANGCTGTDSIAQVSGSGSFSFAAAMTAVVGIGGPPPISGNYFNISNFSGTSALLGIYAVVGDAPANEVISGSGAGSNLTVGYFGCNSPVYSHTATGDTYELLDPQITNPAGCDQGTGTAAFVNEAPSNPQTPSLSFLNTTLAPLRAALPTVPGAAGDPALASGITDARIYRVGAQQCSIGIDVEQ
jgi:hypothetical protein